MNAVMANFHRTSNISSPCWSGDSFWKRALLIGGIILNYCFRAWIITAFIKNMILFNNIKNKLMSNKIESCVWFLSKWLRVRSSIPAIGSDFWSDYEHHTLMHAKRVSNDTFRHFSLLNFRLQQYRAVSNYGLDGRFSCTKTTILWYMKPQSLTKIHYRMNVLSSL
jgi:hypothetical protein